jgi:hypothetical protein
LAERIVEMMQRIFPLIDLVTGAAIPHGVMTLYNDNK